MNIIKPYSLTAKSWKKHASKTTALDSDVMNKESSFPAILLKMMETLRADAMPSNHYAQTKWADSQLHSSVISGLKTKQPDIPAPYPVNISLKLTGSFNKNSAWAANFIDIILYYPYFR